MTVNELKKSGAEHGAYPVWLKGSRKTIRRAVYDVGDLHYIIYAGSAVEVIRGLNEYVTVDMY